MLLYYQSSFLLIVYYIILLFLVNNILNEENSIKSKKIHLLEGGSLEIIENKDKSIEIDTKSGKIYKSQILILVIPGGCYVNLQPKEGLPVVEKFLSFGYSCAILKYSVHPKCYPIEYNQGLKAIKLLSSRFKKIILMGFSAGGHLSALLGTTEREKLFNAVGMVLCYPVISFVNKVHKGSRDNFFGDKNKNNKENRKRFSIENRVSPNTLPTFIWTCKPDRLVPYENSLFMIKKLEENKVFHSSIIFKTGRHGIILAEKNKEVSKWIKLACDFMDKIVKN